MTFDVRLPPDLKRAAPDIYRTIRASGASSVRDWLRINYQGKVHAETWTDLWTSSTSVDMALASQASERDRTIALATDDILELTLRRLSSFELSVAQYSQVADGFYLLVHVLVNQYGARISSARERCFFLFFFVNTY